jgi:hypothetical protein
VLIMGLGWIPPFYMSQLLTITFTAVKVGEVFGVVQKLVGRVSFIVFFCQG